MTISREDALAALGDVQAAEARTVIARSNRLSAPYLFLWGVIWIVGYVMTGALPGREAGMMWPWLAGFGVVTNFIMSARMHRRGLGHRSMMIMPFLGATAFFFATYWVMRPTETTQYLVFPPLFVSMLYMVMGGIRPTRLMWVGIALFVLTVLGYAYLQPILAYYLATVGGGGLILGGLWLRAA